MPLYLPGGGGGTPDAHATSHEDGGGDEIDATGLTGVGGSFTQAFLGTNAIGASTRTSTSFQVMQAVTPAAAGQIVSVGAYLTFNGAQIWSVMAGIMEDATGAPGKVVASGSSIIFGAATARWVDIGVGYKAAAATQIWLVVAVWASSGNFGWAYDAGTDAYKATGQYIDEPNAIATADNRKYSIRASQLT